MKKLQISFLELCFLFVLFCFAISIFNLAGYIFAVIVVLLFFFKATSISISHTDFIVFLFSIGYTVFLFLHYGLTVNDIILFLIGPLSAYILGKAYIKTSKSDYSLMIFITVLSIGMYFHGLLNVVAYLRSDYSAYYEYYRQSVDFWRDELVNVKTTEMLYTFATGLGMGVLFSKSKLLYKMISTIIVIISVGVAAFLANRTLILVFIALAVWRTLVLLLNHKIRFETKLAVVFGILFLGVVAVYIVVNNKYGVRDFIFSLKIVERFTSNSELTRFEVWGLFFDEMRFLDYPFGGKFLTIGSEFGYLHNMWLDVYNVAGIIPFLFLIVLSGKFILEYFDFSRVMKKYEKDDENIILQTLMLSTLMNMMVEPIVEANPYYFLIVLMFMGAMNEYKKKVKETGELVCEDSHSM